MKYDLTGKKFGRLIVLSYCGLDNTGKNSKWLCKCECGNETIVGRPCLIQLHTKSCGCLCSPPVNDYNEQQEKDFFKYVNKTNTCWIWEGSKDKEGYGIFHERCKKIKAHRYAYTKYKGIIRGAHMICHTCDNPSCVNPDHLYEGTHKDNMKDIRDRKRWGGKRKPIEEKQKNAIRILHDNGVSNREISEVLKISLASVINHIKK